MQVDIRRPFGYSSIECGVGILSNIGNNICRATQQRTKYQHCVGVSVGGTGILCTVPSVVRDHVEEKWREQVLTANH